MEHARKAMRRMETKRTKMKHIEMGHAKIERAKVEFTQRPQHSHNYKDRSYIEKLYGSTVPEITRDNIKALVLRHEKAYLKHFKLVQNNLDNMLIAEKAVEKQVIYRRLRGEYVFKYASQYQSSTFDVKDLAYAPDIIGAQLGIQATTVPEQVHPLPRDGESFEPQWLPF